MSNAKGPQPVPTGEQRQFKVKSRLTIPIISMAHTEQLFAKVTGKMLDEHIESFGKGAEGLVSFLPVINLQDNQPAKLVASAVIKSALEKYGDYVGKSFMFKAGIVAEGKKYRMVDIYELEEDK